MKPSEVLFKAWKLFRGGKGWGRGVYRQEINGEVCYCVSGAILHAENYATPVYKSSLARRYLRNALQESTGRRGIVAFNDDPKTTYADISRLFRRAAQMAREEGR